jgi:hypothetical protein
MKTSTMTRNSLSRIALSLSGAALLGFASVGLASADGPDRLQTSNSGALPVKLSPPAPDKPGDLKLPETDDGGGGVIGEAIALIVCPDGTTIEYNPGVVSDPYELCPPMLGEPPYDPGMDVEEALQCEDVEPGVTFGKLELRDVWGWYMENCGPTPWSCETALRNSDDLDGARDWYGENCVEEPVYEPSGEAPDRPGDGERPTDDGDRPVPGNEPGEPVDEPVDEPASEPVGEPSTNEGSDDSAEGAGDAVETEEQALEEDDDEPAQPETTADKAPEAPLPPKAGAGNALTTTSGGIGLGIFALVATLGGAAGALLRSKTRA